MRARDSLFILPKIKEFQLLCQKYNLLYYKGVVLKVNEEIKKKLKENFDVALEGGTSLISGVLSNTLIGQVAPGIATTYLAYKQKRSEKNNNYKKK